MADASPTTPPLQCLSCWYTIGTHDATACPECGEPVTEQTHGVFDRRREVTKHASRSAMLGTLATVAGVGSHFVAAFLISGRPSIAIYVTMYFVILAASGLLLGLAVMPWSGAARRSPEPQQERELVFKAWSAHLVWLQAPWLVSPLMAMTLYAVVNLSERSERAEHWQFVTLFILVTLWVCVLINTISIWSMRWLRDIALSGLGRTETPGKANMAAGVLLIVSIPTGFFGSVLYTFAIYNANHLP